VTLKAVPTERDMERVFAVAPFTKLGSSVDLFILQIDTNWLKSRSKHPAYPAEILTLTLSDVIKHRPVAQEHLEYYRNIGSRCGIYLDEPIFERAWLHWIANETIQSSLNAATRLQSALNIETSASTKGIDKYKWEEIAKLVLRPNEAIKPKPSSIEVLLSNIRNLADAVSAARDSEQFYLACAIEWIDLRLQKDPLKKKGVKEILLEAMANAKELPLGQASDQTNEALRQLADTYPRAFTESLSPITIAYIVQLLTEARTKKLKPQTFSRIIYSLDSKSRSSTLITFVLATSLGIELTNQLILVLTQEDQAPMNWELPI
jgi:hypothetical protein